MSFYQGIVEQDNVNYGYVKVRIFGKHSHDRSILPTADLPNAKIVYSGESNIDEQSYFRTIKNGSWVICGFMDESEQYPIVLGSVVKDVQKFPNFTQGFSDPNAEHPSQLGTTISSEASNVAKYPNNRVLKTKGHLIEIDDTTGSERINVLHKSGTKIEIDSTGKLTITGTANIDLSASTDIILNGSGDFAVSWTDLDTIWQAMVLLYNAHTHPVSGSTAATTPNQIIPPNTNLNLAKVDTVKLP